MGIFDELPMYNLEHMVLPYKAKPTKASDIFERIDAKYLDSWEKNWVPLLDNDSNISGLYYPSSSISDLTPLWQFANVEDNKLDIKLPELFVFTALPPIYFPENHFAGLKYNERFIADFSTALLQLADELNETKPILQYDDLYELSLEEIIPLVINDNLVDRYNNNYNDFEIPDRAVSAALTVKITNVHSEKVETYVKVLFLQMENQCFVNELSHLFNIQVFTSFNPGWANHFSHTLISKFEELVNSNFKPKYLVRRDGRQELDYDNDQEASEALPNEIIHSIEYVGEFYGYDLFQVEYP